MCAAFSNPSSKESLENKFEIGNDCATPENARLLIVAMYEGELNFQFANSHIFSQADTLILCIVTLAIC